MVENKVAKIIKIYAKINFVCGVLIAIFAGVDAANHTDYGFFVFIGCAFVFAVVSFGIYAIGEIIQLLEDIKNNTKQATSDNATNNCEKSKAEHTARADTTKSEPVMAYNKEEKKDDTVKTQKVDLNNSIDYEWVCPQCGKTVINRNYCRCSYVRLNSKS